MYLLEVPLEEVRDILIQASSRVVPDPKTVTHLLDEHSLELDVISTGLRGLDDMLRGGLPCGSLAEVVGPSGQFTTGRREGWMGSLVLTIHFFRGVEVLIEELGIQRAVSNPFPFSLYLSGGKKPAGIGKSTFCLTATCLTTVAPRYGGLGACVAYLDTEGKFSAKR